MSSSDEKSETGGSDKTPTPMGKSDVAFTVSDARSRFAQAKSGGDVSSGGFAARAQGAGDCNANAGSQQGTGEKK
ncbi:hypothetical protein CC77DRAFT_1091112 [Alternaria alternata]|uniref:SMP domain-containing protein n=1 Tax=Alternaria alternata TaxID=5599 RepID=A0A177E0V4_ALTAL|nr:hypothetical protein CC77DRAFT_1091112 [Alternaria alternata]XP_051585916.1 uncharacterized protein J4E82_008083 [Alternaria postmessia]KAI5373213.1 hypothetical protein J4E82_008083 [Alternaria postmessia]OAG25604.1 hypothetical protein CC77DRAFT_1091112 [Alternaria alternata]